MVAGPFVSSSSLPIQHVNFLLHSLANSCLITAFFEPEQGKNLKKYGFLARKVEVFFFCIIVTVWLQSATLRRFAENQGAPAKEAPRSVSSAR